MVLYLSVLLGLYVVPIYITSPCIMDPVTLKPRPDVIGHRGTPMVSHLAWHHLFSLFLFAVSLAVLLKSF